MSDFCEDGDCTLPSWIESDLVRAVARNEELIERAISLARPEIAEHLQEFLKEVHRRLESRVPIISKQEIRELERLLVASQVPCEEYKLTELMEVLRRAEKKFQPGTDYLLYLRRKRGAERGECEGDGEHH